MIHVLARSNEDLSFLSQDERAVTRAVWGSFRSLVGEVEFGARSCAAIARDDEETFSRPTIIQMLFDTVSGKKR